jgi:hypothetical protein
MADLDDGDEGNNGRERRNPTTGNEPPPIVCHTFPSSPPLLSILFSCDRVPYIFFGKIL